jgi:hypothetical protein
VTGKTRNPTETDLCPHLVVVDTNQGFLIVMMSNGDTTHLKHTSTVSKHMVKSYPTHCLQIFGKFYFNQFKINQKKRNQKAELPRGHNILELALAMNPT